MNENVTFQINVAGNIFTVVGELQGDLTQIVANINRVDNSVNQTFNNLKNKVASINLSSIIDQTKQVAEGLAALSGPGAGFEQSMADLSSITGTVGQDLVDLGKIARQTGVESGLGADQAARAFSILASQIEVDDIGLDGLKELQRNSITLAQAAGITMDEAANALAGTINQYGLEAGEAARVINVLAAGSKYGAAEINDLAQSFKVVGAQASIAGLSVEDTAGALEILSKNNVKGAEAGTDLRNIILAMQTTLGVDFSKNTLAEALDALKPKLNDAAFMSQTFGRMSMGAAQYLVQNAEAVADMTTKVTGTSTAIAQATTRTDTVANMMARCRAKVDDVKIGFFDLTGSLGGYATVVAEQLVTVSQLVPLFSLMGKVTKIWTGVQWLLNTSLYGCPIVWIVAGVAALVAIIAVCVTKVQGWGAQWDSIVNFMKLSFQLYCETVKYYFNTVVDGIMLGLDYIRLGWYKFKEAVGMGDSAENQSVIAKISGDIERRQNEIVEGAKKIRDLAVETAGSLKWELSWKKGGNDIKDDIIDSPVTLPVTPQLAGGGLDIDLSGKGRRGSGGSGGGLSGTLDLNRIVPNLKGSTAYSAIARRLAPVAMAASVAMPLSVASAMMPQDTTGAEQGYAQTEYPAAGGARRGGVTMTKFCDNVVINIARPDGRGMDEIRKEVIKVLEEVIDDYNA